MAFVLASMSEKALAQVKSDASELIGDKLPKEQADKLVEKLAGGQWTHDYGLTAKEAKSLGFNITSGIAPSVLKLMQLYPQPVRQLPSIEFLPRGRSGINLA